MGFRLRLQRDDHPLSTHEWLCHCLRRPALLPAAASCSACALAIPPGAREQLLFRSLAALLLAPPAAPSPPPSRQRLGGSLPLTYSILVYYGWPPAMPPKGYKNYRARTTCLMQAPLGHFQPGLAGLSRSLRHCTARAAPVARPGSRQTRPARPACPLHTDPPLLSYSPTTLLPS